MEPKLGVLFVCTANICRSPLAEAVFRSKAARAGLDDSLLIASAATHDFRIGEPADARARRVGERRGYDLPLRQARRITRADLERFDYVLGMDMANMTALHRLGEPDLWQKPKLLLSYSRLYREREIADPYAADEERFELVLDMIESATDGLLAAIRGELGNGR
ncbi:MAG: low molecular weight protein-tyrosine-phosphatase [Actinomycetota bacterium]